MILETSGVIWGGSKVILKCRITNFSVEPSIQNHNKVPGLIVSTQLLPSLGRIDLHFSHLKIQHTSLMLQNSGFELIQMDDHLKV